MVLMLALVAGLAWQNRQRLIQLFVAQANQHLATPVLVEAIDLTFWKTFPQVSLHFRNVTVLGSLPQPDTLARLQDIYVSFNARKLWNRQYEISRISLANGRVFLRTDAAGRTNFDILKKDSTGAAAETPGQQAVTFNLKRIKLDQVRLGWEDARHGHHIVLANNSLVAALERKPNGYALSLDQQGQLQNLKLAQVAWLTGKPLTVTTGLFYNDKSRELSLDRTRLHLAGADFAGNCQVALGKKQLNLKLQAAQASIKTLLALAPENVRQAMAAYQSQGQVQFDLAANGSYAAGATPHIDLKFGAQDLVLFHPDYKQRLEQARFSGRFTNGRSNSNKTAELRIDSLYAQLDGRPLTGSFLLQNLADPLLDLQLDTRQSLPTLLQFYQVKGLKSATGEAEISLHLRGKVNDLKAGRNLHQIKTDGELLLENVSLVPEKGPALQDLNGQLLLDGKNLSLDNLSLRYGRTDARLHGLLGNLVPHLLDPSRAPLLVDLQARSQFVDLDQIMALLQAQNLQKANAQTGAAAPASGEEATQAEVRQALALRQIALDINIDYLRYQRLNPRQLSTTLSIRQGQWNLQHLRMKLAGGEITATTQIDARHPEALVCTTLVKTSRLEADSIFWLSHDFGQTFLTHKNLGGKITADVNAAFTLDRHLHLERQSLLVLADIAISQGRLQDFEPLQQLGTVLKKGNLRQITFSELKNSLRIDDQVIYIPDMQIASNVFDVNIRGSQNFNGFMDYKLRVPLRNFARQDADAAFGEVADDGSGRSNLLLTMKGYPGKMQVALDKQATRQSVKETIKKEKEEFLDLFRKNKSQPQTQPAAPRTGGFMDEEDDKPARPSQPVAQQPGATGTSKPSLLQKTPLLKAFQKPAGQPAQTSQPSQSSPAKQPQFMDEEEDKPAAKPVQSAPVVSQPAVQQPVAKQPASLPKPAAKEPAKPAQPEFLDVE